MASVSTDKAGLRRIKFMWNSKTRTPLYGNDIPGTSKHLTPFSVSCVALASPSAR